MKKINKILLAVLTLFTINLANIKADEIKVARINDTDYTSLDEAINAASDETTIELLNDAETAGMNLNKNIIIEGVPAMNAHHNPDDCVGFIMDIDGIRIYGAGDTSYFEGMQYFKNLDYAILPTDGIYNMDMAEASKVADLLDTKYAIPVHMAPGHLFDKEKVKAFKTKKALVLQPGQEITLGA